MSNFNLATGGKTWCLFNGFVQLRAVLLFCKLMSSNKRRMSGNATSQLANKTIKPCAKELLRGHGIDVTLSENIYLPSPLIQILSMTDKEKICYFYLHDYVS